MDVSEGIRLQPFTVHCLYCTIPGLKLVYKLKILDRNMEFCCVSASLKYLFLSLSHSLEKYIQSQSCSVVHLEDDLQGSDIKVMFIKCTPLML